MSAPSCPGWHPRWRWRPPTAHFFVRGSHDGPVWQVAWAHPTFGNLLASGSYDRKVIVWKETPAGWEPVKEHLAHESSSASQAVVVGCPPIYYFSPSAVTSG